jgi:hypothetical protein
MFDTSVALLEFEEKVSEEKETVLEIGRFQCDTVDTKVRCGNGKCRYCNCSAFQVQSQN